MSNATDRPGLAALEQQPEPLVRLGGCAVPANCRIVQSRPRYIEAYGPARERIGARLLVGRRRSARDRTRRRAACPSACAMSCVRRAVRPGGDPPVQRPYPSVDGSAQQFVGRRVRVDRASPEPVGEVAVGGERRHGRADGTARPRAPRPPEAHARAGERTATPSPRGALGAARSRATARRHHRPPVAVVASTGGSHGLAAPRCSICRSSRCDVGGAVAVALC